MSGSTHADAGAPHAPVFAGRTLPLSRVEFTMHDVYPPTHWAIRGMPPAYDTADEDVYLAGRHTVLLTKAWLVASPRGPPRLAQDPAELFELPRSEALPVTYIIDDKGKVREQLMGEQTAAGVMAKLEALQAKN